MAAKSYQRSLEQRRQEQIDALVLEHLGLVETIARRVWRRYTSAGQGGYSCQIELEDMVACGYVGLVQAARRYRAGKDTTFAKFAFLRIRGAIIERHRRAAYRDMQHESIEAAGATVADSRAGNAQDEKTSGVPYSMGSALNIAEAMRDRGPLPDEQLVRRELEELAVRAIRMLPDDERLVIIDALRGADLWETARARGRSVAWARAKLAEARRRVAAQVARDQRAA